MKKAELKKFKKTLSMKTPILGVFFRRQLPAGIEPHQDTACTAIARSFFNDARVVLNSKSQRQLCPGADYFLKLSKRISMAETLNVYAKEEQVFRNKKICAEYLSHLPELPRKLKNKDIFIKPFAAGDKPDILLLLANPAQAGRILGLANYDRYKDIKVNPCQPACLALFAPLATGHLHINFIDYYDRYCQGIICGREVWPEEKMIISMTLSQFKQVCDNLKASPYGLFKPSLSVQTVDSF